MSVSILLAQFSTSPSSCRQKNDMFKYNKHLDWHIAIPSLISCIRYSANLITCIFVQPLEKSTQNRKMDEYKCITAI